MPLFTGQDETLACKDCGQSFIFTQGEAKFYDEQGFADKPKRCKPCRIAKKAQKAQQTGAEQPRFPSDSNYPPQQNYGNGNGNARPAPGRSDGNSRQSWDGDRGGRRNKRDDY